MAPSCARCCIAQRSPHTREPVVRGTSDSSSPGLYPDESFPGIIAGLPRPIWASPCRELHPRTYLRKHRDSVCPYPALFRGTPNVSRGFIVRLALATAYPGKPFSIGHPRSPRQRGVNFPCPGNNRGKSSLTPRHEDRPCQDNSHGQGSTSGHATPRLVV